MKIRLLSDLHQEFYYNARIYEPLGEDVLVIAGDLDVGTYNIIKSLKEFAKTVKHVLYVTGNHEYYLNDMNSLDTILRNEFIGTNVHFLNPGSVKIGDVTFIGSNLWSNFHNNPIAQHLAARCINDFRNIRGFDTDKCAQLHNAQRDAIKFMYENTPGTKVIVTHFVPDLSLCNEQYKGDILNKYFAADLGNWIADLEDVPYWFYGHTHIPSDITIGNTRCICNPYGYNYNPKYKEMVVEV